MMMLEVIHILGVALIMIVCVSVIGAGTFTLLWQWPKPKRARPLGFPLWWDEEERRKE